MIWRPTIRDVRDSRMMCAGIFQRCRQQQWGQHRIYPMGYVVCFTYRIDIAEKTYDHDKAPQGAHFRLYSDKDCKNEALRETGDTGYHVINRDSQIGTDHTGGSQPQDAVEMVSQRMDR